MNVRQLDSSRNNMGSYECDVLVIGSGAGGLSTAITAKHLGLDVLVVEKEPLVGGTTARSGGYLWIPGNSVAKRHNVDTSGSDVKKYLRGQAKNFFREDLVDTYLNNASKVVDYFEEKTEVKFTYAEKFSDYHSNEEGGVAEGRSIYAAPYDGTRLGRDLSKLAKPLQVTLFWGFAIGSGPELKHFLRATKSINSAWFVARRIAAHFWDVLVRGHDTRLVNGRALTARLYKSALDLGIPIWTSTEAKELRQEGGRVVGAALVGEKSVQVTARKGVVLATGGFPHDYARRKALFPHAPNIGEHFSVAPYSNTGDGIRMAEKVGAVLTETSDAGAWIPISRVPGKIERDSIFPHLIDRAKPGIIAVTRKGKRFVNESNSYHDFLQGLFRACEAGEPIEAFLIADHRAIRNYGLGYVKPYPLPMGEHLRSGYLKRGRTIEELAQNTGIDPAGLVAAIERYNGYARRGEDPDFGKGSSKYNHIQGDMDHKPNPCLAPIDRGPFYAVRVEPGDIATFSGLNTTPNAEVVDGADRVISGLYAVGTDMGSIFGGSYPGGGSTLGPAMTFGYLAAHHMAGA